MDMRNLPGLTFIAIAMLTSCLGFADGRSTSINSVADSSEQSNHWWVHSVSSGGWEFKWSGEIMLAINDTTGTLDTLFVNHSIPQTDTSDYYYEDEYRVMSIVGPYVSWSYSYDGSGGPHPIAGIRYETHVPGNFGRISLPEIFPEIEIQRALLADTLILSHLRKQSPANLTDLVGSLDGGCEMDLDDILTSFAIGAIESDSVTVNFGITHGCEVMRGNFTEMTIKLPLPGNQRQMFIEARKNQTTGW